MRSRSSRCAHRRSPRGRHGLALPRGGPDRPGLVPHSRATALIAPGFVPQGLVMQTLESKGVLQKMRAQVRELHGLSSDKDGPNHLGLRCNASHGHQMALTTSDCGSSAPRSSRPSRTSRTPR